MLKINKDGSATAACWDLDIPRKQYIVQAQIKIYNLDIWVDEKILNSWEDAEKEARFYKAANPDILVRIVLLQAQTYALAKDIPGDKYE